MKMMKVLTRSEVKVVKIEKESNYLLPIKNNHMRILIIEDEQYSTDYLEKLLQGVAPGKNIVGKCHSIQEALLWFDQNEYPDLILSDVEISDGLSFDIFNQLDKKIPVIYFSTSDNYALNAFKAQGIHYLLKPVNPEELKEALHRYDKINYAERKSIQEINYPTNGLAAALKPYQERFIINVGTQIKLIYDTEIAYLYTESKSVFIVTSSNQKYRVDYSLEKFEKNLNPKLFYRINRQFIVSLKSITKMMSASKQRIKLTLVPACSYDTITSFERTPLFKKWLMGDTSNF